MTKSVHELVSKEERGKLIRKRRRDLKIDQIEIAKFCNLSHTGIGKIEMGKLK